MMTVGLGLLMSLVVLFCTSCHGVGASEWPDPLMPHYYPPTRRLKGHPNTRTLNGDTMFSTEHFDSTFTRKKNSNDSLKACEKMRDKYGITCSPSQVPTQSPSHAPSVSMQPSLSQQPSSAPSDRPSISPSKAPSETPTEQPSSPPTIAPTGQPSVPPTIQPTTLSPTVTPFASLVLSREDGSLWQDNTCQTSIPVRASTPLTESTLFEYFLWVSPNTDARRSMQQTEQALATSLAKQVLTCGFAYESNTEAPFEIFAISSLPSDRENANACPYDGSIEIIDGAECHRILAGFTPTIFYMGQRRRHLQSQSEIVQYFGPLLQQLLDSDEFLTDGVVGTQYSGFLIHGGETGSEGGNINTGSAGIASPPVITINSNNNGDDSSGNGGSSGSSGGGPSGSFSTSSGGGPSEGSTTISTAAIQGDGTPSNNPDEGTFENPGHIIGAIVICLAGVVLLLVAAVVIRRRKLRQGEFKEIDDSSGADLDLVAEFDEDGEKKDDNNNNLQEGHPDDHDSRYIHTITGVAPAAAAADLQEAPKMQDDDEEDETFQTRSFSSAAHHYPSTTPSVQTADARRAVRGLQYSVVDDDQTCEDSLLDLESAAGNDPHDYANCKNETCFKCRARNLPQPTFLKADLQAIQSELGSTKKYKPRYNRQYIASDTVNL